MKKPLWQWGRRPLLSQLADSQVEHGFPVSQTSLLHDERWLIRPVLIRPMAIPSRWSALANSPCTPQ